MNVILVGYGQMGKLLEATLTKQGHSIAGVVHPGMFDSATDVPGKVDAVVDFSYPGNLEGTLEYVKQTGCALVLGTTGLSAEQIAAVKEVSKRAPVVHSSNYSTGVAILKMAVAAVMEKLPEGFDIEIIETHHNKKADAPSGTAKMLLDVIDPDGEYEHVHGREGATGKRGHEIGIHAVRGGTVAGEHSVKFFGEDEMIELRHSATSRQIFVNGAAHALKFAAGREPGLYNMDDVLKGSVQA